MPRSISGCWWSPWWAGATTRNAPSSTCLTTQPTPRALARARPLQAFAQHYPATASAVADLLGKQGVAMEDALFLPVLHKQEWVAVLDKSARILGFVPGDGFAVP